MNPQTLKYLQKDQIGKVIATGLATLYMNKPQKPVRYLAQWLKNYSDNERQMAKVINQQKQKVQKAIQLEKANEEKEAAQNFKRQAIQKENKEKQQFKDMIVNHQYHEELLNQTFAEFLQKNTKATGVYIGELNHPPKEVTEEDTDENAHLNTAAEKVINYIGSSVSHKQLMRGKILNENQGITASVFSLLEETTAPVIGQDGQQIPQPPKPKYIFVPNVVKNQKLHYFKIPKLGSYLAMPIICNQYLTEYNFDVSFAAKLQYIKECEQLEKTKKQQLEELFKEKQDFENKIKDLKQKNADPSQLQPLETELKDVEEAIKEKQEEAVEQKPLQLVSQKRKYVICADTLGKDEQFTQNEIEFIKNLAEHFKESWQNKQQQLLKNDVDTQVQLLKGLSNPPETIKQQLQNSQQLTQEESKEIATIPQQNVRNHKQHQVELQKLKEYIIQNNQFLQSFEKLRNFRVVKYQNLIQNLLYLLGHRKKEVNSHNRTTLNWKQVKTKLINQATFNKIFQYNPIGPKTQQYVFYNKTSFLLEQFQKYNEEQIFKYNIALGAIVVFIRKALELRQADVELRRQKHENETKNRENLKEQNQKTKAKMDEELQKHKTTLPAEELQSFNEEEWTTNYYLSHPLHEIPPQIQQDINNDM